MSSYRIPWVPIKSPQDWPPASVDVLVTLNGSKRVLVDHVVKGWGGWYSYDVGKVGVIAYAPLPAPYDPSAPAPVDPRDAEIAELRARCARLAAVVDAYQSRGETIYELRQSIAHYLPYWEGPAGDPDVAENMRREIAALDAYRPGDLEVSEP